MKPTIATDGDELEQTGWKVLSDHFQHYEEFWNKYVVPLRVPGKIWLRNGLDEGFEQLAMLNYTTFVYLWRSYLKIWRQDENFKFFEEIYGSLQRCAEVALKTATCFEQQIVAPCKRVARIDARRLQKVRDTRLNDYRNMLHDPLIATLKDRRGRRQVPRYERLDSYRLWSNVRYGAREEDFVDVEVQLQQDFHALCSGLNDCWRQICREHSGLSSSPEFNRRQQQGDDRSAPVTMFVVSRFTSN